MNKLGFALLFTAIGIGMVGTLIETLIATPVSSYAQQQTNYVATLSGKDMVPSVETPATGVARFHMNPDGSLCYSVNVYHITGVLGAHIGTRNGTELADLTNPSATMQFYPIGRSWWSMFHSTASVNGKLTSGEIKEGIRGAPGKGGVVSPLSLVGPLIGKNVADLDNILKNQNGYVTVRTLDHQRGELQGQILPTSSTVSCPTTMRFPPTSTAFTQ